MTEDSTTGSIGGATDRPAGEQVTVGHTGSPSGTHPDGDRRATDFVASLPEPSNNPRTADDPGRHNTYARVGFLIMIIGLVLAIIAVIMSQSTNNPLDQSTQISMGIAGIAAVVFGGVVFLRYSLGQLLRFWLLRMLHEQHPDDTQ